MDLSFVNEGIQIDSFSFQMSWDISDTVVYALTLECFWDGDWAYNIWVWGNTHYKIPLGINLTGQVKLENELKIIL